ncbi:hypothetical protein OPT61_g4963 [Boeremia exigua]|uniref:Uncharacterized protein n=1 Tax=Boeremia exigua TaxID=749465 RepID=A0ACC2IC92_9PLEO|nr:hypothetical protein OPT61_g4963 [Boeremia exigua]
MVDPLILILLCFTTRATGLAINTTNTTTTATIAVRDGSTSNAEGLSNEAIIGIVMGIAAVAVPVILYVLSWRKEPVPQRALFYRSNTLRHPSGLHPSEHLIETESFIRPRGAAHRDPMDPARN